MSLFEELYEHLPFCEDATHAGDTLIQTASACQCLNCNAFTVWMSTGLMMHVCSEECCENLWEDYYKFLNKDKKRAN